MGVDFRIQEEVFNPARPEWGVGKVLSVEPGQGGGSVRVRVNFAGAGVKTLAIPPGRLARPEAASPASPPANGSQASPTSDEARLQSLPETIFDRQRPLEDRWVELVQWYRFGDGPRGIFDWAAARLARKDPLRDFSADELAQFHDQFVRRRDHALRTFHREAQATGQGQNFQTLIDRNSCAEHRKRVKDALSKGR